MARTPTPTTPLTDDAPIDGQAVAEIQNSNAELQAASNDERDLVHQLLGQAQMAGAFEEFSRTVRTSKLAYVKENKLYKAIAGKTTPNGSEFNGTWEEFCNMLGISVDKADLDITNLKAFGEEALESMSAMGIGYRQMRAYRRLPEDEKTALIEVAKDGDKEAFVELAEEMISKHAKEKAELAERAEEAEANCGIKDQVIESKNNKIDELDIQLHKIRQLPPDEVAQQLRNEANTFADRVEEQIRIQLTTAFREVQDWGNGDSVIDPTDYLTHRLNLLDDAIMHVRREVGIERTEALSNTPEWAEGFQGAQSEGAEFEMQAE